ncbi:MAG: hypothetical protein HC923_12540 [Myxococcales bacterium]|nr:hypothetical protein [Myxococcales bacterium]
MAGVKEELRQFEERFDDVTTEAASKVTRTAKSLVDELRRAVAGRDDDRE